MNTLTKKIYLGGPYSDADPRTRRRRFDAANIVAGELINQGHYVISPISQNHPIAEVTGMPLGWEYWKGMDEWLLGCCEELRILKLPGYTRSKGLAAEIQIAKALEMKIKYVEFDYILSLERVHQIK